MRTQPSRSLLVAGALLGFSAVGWGCLGGNKTFSGGTGGVGEAGGAGGTGGAGGVAGSICGVNITCDGGAPGYISCGDGAPVDAGAPSPPSGVSFAHGMSVRLAQSGAALELADVNGDGSPDLVVAYRSTSGSIGVFLNPGDGTLNFPQQAAGYATDSLPQALALGDLNGDGKLDLVVAGGDTAPFLDILANKGDGTFADRTSQAVGGGARSIALGDLNGDGKTDVALAIPNVDTGGVISVFLNTGNGTFAAPTDYHAGELPFSVAIVDLNGDGKADLAAANNVSSSVSVLLGKGDGTLATATEYPAGQHPTSLAVADFDGDGQADLATAIDGPAVSVLLNRGGGSFGAATSYLVGGGRASTAHPNIATSVAVGDLDGDGKPDLAVAHGASSGCGGFVSILINDSAGAFDAPLEVAVDWDNLTFPQAVKLADLNRDGKLDVTTVSSAFYAASVMLNTTH